MPQLSRYVETCSVNLHPRMPLAALRMSPDRRSNAKPPEVKASAKGPLRRFPLALDGKSSHLHLHGTPLAISPRTNLRKRLYTTCEALFAAENGAKRGVTRRSRVELFAPAVRTDRKTPRNYDGTAPAKTHLRGAGLTGRRLLAGSLKIQT